MAYWKTLAANRRRPLLIATVALESMNLGVRRALDVLDGGADGVIMVSQTDDDLPAAAVCHVKEKRPEHLVGLRTIRTDVASATHLANAALADALWWDGPFAMNDGAELTKSGEYILAAARRYPDVIYLFPAKSHWGVCRRMDRDSALMPVFHTADDTGGRLASRTDRSSSALWMEKGDGNLVIDMVKRDIWRPTVIVTHSNVMGVGVRLIAQELNAATIGRAPERAPAAAGGN
jgi:hypothetical protein